MKRSIILYLLVICISLAMIALVIYRDGGGSAAGRVHSAEQAHPLHAADTAAPAAAILQQPFSLLLMQVIVILIAGYGMIRLVRLLRQPAVVGEMLAGICLGPSLLGRLSPSVSHWLFPAGSLHTLSLLSQTGLVFFMFVIGMELDLSSLRRRVGQAVMISHVSIVFPFLLGVWLAGYIYRSFIPLQPDLLSFSLFMGISVSVTAFPVLVRIVQQRKLGDSPLGILAITCAAADDVTAWCILALVVATIKAGTLLAASLTIGLALAYTLAMLFLVRPRLARKINRWYAGGRTSLVIAVVLMIVLTSAWITESLGIHALFGAFLAGIIMPANSGITTMLKNKVDGLILLLMPVFFACTGLRTQIGLIGSQGAWMLFGLIMLVAVGGKFGGSALTARLMGLSWPDSLSIGALMNTRGLMELIVLNIGYELGILPPDIFAMMVLMALCTTFMTGPALDLIHYINGKYSRRRLIGLRS